MAQNRTQFIRRLMSPAGDAVDRAVMRALIRCLAPDDVVNAFDCTIQQPYEGRRLLLQQMEADAEAGALPCHADLARRLLSVFDSLHYTKKQGCASTLDFLYEFVGDQLRRDILKLFF